MRLKQAFSFLFFMMFFYNAAASACFDTGILWQVESVSGQKNLLFGTMHLIDEDVNGIYKRIEKKISEVRSINVEYLLTNDDLPVLNKMLLKTDIKISSRLSSEDYKNLIELTEIKNIPFEMVEHASPAYIFSLLTNPKAIFEMQMDFKIMEYATKNGVSLYGLDSFQNTFDIITSLDDTYFISAIKDILNEPEITQKHIEEAKSLYLTEDLAMMDLRIKNSISNPEMAKAFYDEAVTRRNKIMVDNLLPELEKGDAFTAVGAGHLGGEEGMLNLLSQRGYKITRVNI